MRCERCGHANASGTIECRMCRAVMAPPHATKEIGYRQAVASRSVLRPIAGPLQQSRVARRPAARPLSPIEEAERSRADLVGRVIAIDGPFLERPDLDICRILARTLWLVLFVVSPIILLRIVLDTLGGLSALLALLGMLLFLRFLSPTNLFAMFHLAVLLNPLGRRDADQTPVRYLRVRALDGDTEFVARVKGALILGNVMPGDLVSCWGILRGGVLRVRRAFSHRTHSWIEVEASQSYVTLVATLLLVGLLILYFYQPVAHIWQRMHELGPGLGGSL